MDDETRKRFDALDTTVERFGGIADRLADLIETKFEGIDRELAIIVRRLDGQDLQLAAIVTRLDEQDASHDRLMGKVDRLSVKVDQLATLSRAGEEAMTSLDALARRVAKLEAARRGENG